MKWFIDILTDDDGDFDFVSILAILAFVSFQALTIYSVVWDGKELDGVAYGAAVGSLIATAGAAYKLKRNEKANTQ